MSTHVFAKNCSQFLKVIRFWHWYDKMLDMIFAVVVLVLFTESLQSQWGNCLLFTVYLVFPLSFSYLINTFADWEEDAQVGKNQAGEYSKGTILGLAVLSASLTLVIPFFFNNIYVILLVLAGFFFSGFYSLDPFRYKEKGWVGLTVAAFGQRMLFLFFLFLIPGHNGIALFIFIWLGVIGLIVELTHQLVDFSNDHRTQTATFVLKEGIRKSVNLHRALCGSVLIYPWLSLVFNFSGILKMDFLLALILLVYSLQTFKELHYLKQTNKEFQSFFDA